VTTFFFDENLSHRLAACIGALEQDVRHVAHEFGRGTQDVMWIPAVASHGWVVVTGDKRIRRRSHERKALQAAGLVSFFVDKKAFDALGSPFLQASWLLARWDDIVRAAEAASVGDQFGVRGKAKPWMYSLPRL
jgi:hypothetical protein